MGLTEVNTPCTLLRKEGGDKMLNTTDAANHLGISRQRVHQLLTTGKLEGQRVGARGWIITEGALDRYKRSKAPAPEASGNGQ